GSYARLHAAYKEALLKLDEVTQQADLLAESMARSARIHEGAYAELEAENAVLSSRLGTLQAERDGAFALLYELMRDEHFIHGRDSWFKRAHEMCGDICTPGIHAFNSEDAELCQCGQRRADGSVVERTVTFPVDTPSVTVKPSDPKPDDEPD